MCLLRNINKIGEIALGSRLRNLSDKVTEDAQLIYGLYNVDLKPKWFPVYYFFLTRIKENPLFR